VTADTGKPRWNLKVNFEDGTHFERGVRVHMLKKVLKEERDAGRPLTARPFEPVLLALAYRWAGLMDKQEKIINLQIEDVL
jgi:hypothetical protein